MGYFELNHWDDPRSKIALCYKDDDIGYITHAGWCVSKIMHLINKPPNELLNYTLLDFGSGTSRMSRLFSFYFKEVISYDPNKECIEKSLKELEQTNKLGLKLIQNNLSHVIDISELLNTKSKYFDYIVSISVFEHLNKIECQLAFDRIKQLLKINGICFLYLHILNNKNFIENNFHDLINVQKELNIIPYYKYKNEYGNVQIFKYKRLD